MGKLYFIVKYIPGCKHAYILQTADQVGIRETRRLQSIHVMTLDELARGIRFPDSVVRGKWAHGDTHSGTGMNWSFTMYEGPYYIPYTSLVAKDINNLLAVGRCSGFSREVLSSMRIQPIGAMIGQAAGTAAAIAVKSKCKALDVDIRSLQKSLIEDGFIL